MNTIEIFVLLFVLSTIYIHLLTTFGNHVIKKVLSLRGTSTKESNTPNIKGNGSLIGNLERILFFIGVVFQNWTLIAIVVALKTIGRYNKLDNQEFAEYFLIGSLLSLLYSIFLGLFFLFIISNINDFNFLKNSIDTVYKIEIVN